VLEQGVRDRLLSFTITVINPFVPTSLDAVGELEGTPSFPRTRESIGVSRGYDGGFLDDTSGGA